MALITETQTLDLVYEGKTRRFSLSSVSTAQGAEEGPDLSERVGALSLSGGPPKLWSVGWDTAVILDAESEPGALGDATTNQVRKI